MMWLGFAVATLGAIAFVLVGLRRRGAEAAGATETAFNRTLYREKLAEVNAQHASGEIDDGQREALVVEFQRQFLVDNADLTEGAPLGERGRWALPLLALLIPLLAAVIYLNLGAADELALRDLFERRITLLTSAAPETELNPLDAEILTSLHHLAKTRSDRPVYPVLLARLYQDRGDFAAAAEYYRAAIALLPDDGGLMGEYAQALFFAAGNRMDQNVEAAAQAAHSLDPDDQTALGLLGIAAYQDARYPDAIRFWQQAVRNLSASSPSRSALVAGISSAQAKLAAATEQGQGDDSTAAQGLSLVVEVSLGDDFDVPPEATVFVYARAWQGSPMPLAIKRLTRSDLPARITLDESLAMSPELTLASAGEVEVVARVSFSGAAVAAPGDLEGSEGPVIPGAGGEPLSLVIARRIP